jgi:hypothetical protein
MFDAFAAMCRGFNARCTDDEIQALYLKVNEESDRLDPTGGDVMHQAAFSKVMQETEGFLDSDVFLNHLRSIRLMPQDVAAAGRRENVKNHT